MFELYAMDGGGRVCLVFPPKPDPPPMDGAGGIQLDLTPTMPQVWFLDRGYEWHYLAPNFTTYFRMMLYHLGLPQWQLLFTPMGPTPWAKVKNTKTFTKIRTASAIFWIYLDILRDYDLKNIIFRNKTFLFFKVES